MDFFELLREHARTRTETIAVSSRRRSMTYRKLWSRIERATARLQQEWKIGKGDIVAYCGHSHPDALVLFFALARSGARLLPLSPSLSPSNLSYFAQEFRLPLMLEDDNLSLAREVPRIPVKPLSALIATRCPQEPAEVVEDPHHPALLRCREAGKAEVDAYSLAQLWEARTGVPPQMATVNDLLEPAVLSTTVLPLLQCGGSLALP
jgi:acyl-CoA synthetase (AMP-forming)/AMP-acid ligase II